MIFDTTIISLNKCLRELSGITLENLQSIKKPPYFPRLAEDEYLVFKPRTYNDDYHMIIKTESEFYRVPKLLRKEKIRPNEVKWFKLISPELKKYFPITITNEQE